MGRDWEAEWREIVEEHKQALAVYQRARARKRMSEKIGDRFAAAFTRRSVFISERMAADPAWPDPDGPSDSIGGRDPSK